VGEKRLQEDPLTTFWIVRTAILAWWKHPIVKTGHASHLNPLISSLAKFELSNASWTQQNPLDGIKSVIGKITKIRPGILSG